jgi:hypothetical protein
MSYTRSITKARGRQFVRRKLPSNFLTAKKGFALTPYRAYDDLYYLIDKYAPFEDGNGPPRLIDSERATLSGDRDHTKE